MIKTQFVAKGGLSLNECRKEIKGKITSKDGQKGLNQLIKACWDLAVGKASNTKCCVELMSSSSCFV